jgi:hypothetical protein
MDRTLLPEVMIHGMEEIQLFHAQDPKGNKELSEATLIQYALIKLNMTGLYSKAIEHWNAQNITECSTWTDFKTHLINEYERMVREGGGSTFGQEGYGTAYNSIVTDDNSSLVESIIQYAECATVAESKVSALEEQLNALEINQQTAYPQAAYYAPIVHPEYAYFTPQPPMFNPPSSLRVPVQPGIPPPQQAHQLWMNQGGNSQEKKPKRDYNRNPTLPCSSAAAPTCTLPTNNHSKAEAEADGEMVVAGIGTTPMPHTATHRNDSSTCTTVSHVGTTSPKRGINAHIWGPRTPYAVCQMTGSAPIYAHRGACMKGQHKTLPDRTGAGQGLLAQSVTKAQWTMQQQQPNMHQWQGRGQNNGHRYGRQHQWNGGQQQSEWNRGQQWGTNQHWKQS